MNGRAVLHETARVGIFLCVSACGNHPTSPGPIQSQPPPNPQPIHRTINGLVREVNGGGLSDVRIQGWSRTSGGKPVAIGSTAADGSFHFEPLDQDAFSFTKTGYESAGWQIPQNAKLDETFTIVVKMEPTLLLSEGRPIESVITADDLAYSSQGDGDSVELDWPGNVLCSPCKFLFVPAPPRKGGTLTMLSSGGGPPLTMWIADYYSGPVVVATGLPGERQVVAIPADRSWNTVLVGFDHNHGATLSGDVVVRFSVALADQ
jgi:hypothetical protein